MRVALVHDWLTGMRGGERCLEVLCELFPAADLYTLLHVRGSVSPTIERHAIRTSFVQRLPGAAARYRYYLPLFPAAIRGFRLEGYDLVVSLSHCVAKGVRPPPGALHVSYCFSPMRYVWDLYDEYFGPRAGALPRLLMPPVAAGLRRWDRASSRGVHHFVAISRHVAGRIARSYGRPADVIYPPVDVERFTRAAREAAEPTADGGDDFYLVVSALVPYKRVDLAVLAARRLGRRLVVVGTGPEAARLRALGGADVEFVGWQSDAAVADLLGRCRALLFPGLEDFGIVPLEAMAAGRPVIAYAAGGALETVVPPGDPGRPPTGMLFPDQTVEGLAGAILGFEREAGAFVPRALRVHAERFGRPRFKAEMAAYLDARLAEAARC